MRLSLPLAIRRGRGGAVCVLGALLATACSSPLRAKPPGAGGAAGATNWNDDAGSGAGGFQPVTINLGVGGRFGTGGVLAFGGNSSSGGALATGGTVSTPTTLCTAGRCLVTLASGREGIWPTVAVDGAGVYWTEHSGGIPIWPGSGDGRVMKVAVDGAALTTLAARQDFPSFIRVDATSVYWTTWSTGLGGELATSGYASIRRATLDGTKTTTVVSRDMGRDNFYRVHGPIAVDTTSAYWAYEGDSRNDYQDGSILKVSLLDGSTTTLASAQWRPYQVEVDSSNVYWVNVGGTSQDVSDTRLMSTPLLGSAVTTLDASPAGHTVFALDATSVYWVSYSGGAVMRMPLAGGTPVTLASGQSGPIVLAVDAACAYWANHGDGTVMKVPLDGGTPTLIASGQPLIEAIAVDATSVYWTTDGTPANEYKDGTVMRLFPK
jgi:hypothetical protein